jgi:hypothetical protein
MKYHGKHLPPDNRSYMLTKMIDYLLETEKLSLTRFSISTNADWTHPGVMKTYESFWNDQGLVPYVMLKLTLPAKTRSR